jgi:hypothetical protein
MQADNSNVHQDDDQDDYLYQMTTEEYGMQDEPPSDEVNGGG